MRWRIRGVGLLAVATALFCPADLRAGQVVFYDFNDASAPDVAVDQSGNGNDGFMSGALYTAAGGGVTGGASDRAMDLGDFNNGAFLDLTDIASGGAFDSLVDNDQATVAFWLYGNDEQPQDNWTFYFGPDRQLGSHAPWGDGTVYFDVAGCCGANQRISKNIADSSMYKGQWNHFTYVKDETYTAIYINGELFHDSGADLKDPLNFISEAAFGADNLGGNSHGGMMDDISVWDEALDETAIRSLMGAAPPTAVAGALNIGTMSIAGANANLVFGDAGAPTPGLMQEWYSANNPGSKDGVEQVFDSTDTMVAPFQAGHGTTWWSGTDEPIGEMVKYPDEVGAGDNLDQYVVRATGELFVPKSGTYLFTDGVDDYTYWAVDADGSGVAGDSPDEVLIDDNTWTNVLRTGNGGGGGFGEIDLTVPEGGQWIAVEFNMGEGGGGDSGVIYWDYDVANDEVGGALGFPTAAEDPLDPVEAESLYIPDTHLRASVRPLLSGEKVAELSDSRPFAFELNGDNDTSDVIAMANSDPNVYKTVLDVDGVTFLLNTIGNVANGDSFQIIDADMILGTPILMSGDPNQQWVFDPLTGRVTLGSDPFAAIDAITDIDARIAYVHDVAKTWMGDSNLDGEFNSSDLVAVFTVGKYETGEAATWASGDWSGDGVFNSSDFVTAFSDGGYEQGPRAAVAAVPEPASIILAGCGLLALLRFRRK
ncbi:MAG: hypothetical protein KDA92_17425 [Planctomycetales bacterium]|nr:hypothetical protein [Planctomycetales bacterium]